MTCIIADKNKAGKVILVGDRRFSYNDSRYTSSPTPKVFKENGYLIAMSGTVSHFWYLKSCNSLKQLSHKENVLQYLIHSIIPEYRAVLGKTGQLNDDSDSVKDGIESLIVVRGECYSLSNLDGKVHIEQIKLPASAGCGGDLALSAYNTINHLEPLMTKKLNIKDKLKLSVILASRLDSACDNTIDIVQED